MPPTKPRSSIDSQSPHPSPRLSISDEQHKFWNTDQGRRGGEGYPEGSLPSYEEEEESGDATPHAHHVPEYQVYAFTDLVAFRFLEEEKGVDVLDRRQQLEGYEAYLVEQWACSRNDPTFVITTFTGDPSHKITVGLLRVAKDRTQWSEGLKAYFDALGRYHVREKETPLGTLMVTNLSSFPSALNVIHIPDGDVRRHRDAFAINENLKRMGCSGRSALTLSPPSDGSQAKFLQIYRTNDQIPFNSSVELLVQLCQLALCLFDKFAIEYVDGLLCDVTERAINDWWSDIGPDYFDIEPSDGILGPTTVAALLGVVTGARIRLNSVGAPVPKDAFDIQAMKKGIAHFQKHQKLRRSRRLDRETLERLRKVTSKTTPSDRFKVNALKSTIGDLSGKQRSNAEDVETCEFDKFLQNLHGERLKYLWLGKSKKNKQAHASSLALDGERSSPRKDGLISPPPMTASTLATNSSDLGLSGQNIELNNQSTSTLPSTTTSPAHSRTDSSGKVSHGDNSGSPRSSLEITSPGLVGNREHRDRLRKSMFRTMANKNLDSARSTLGGKIKDVAGTMGLASKKQHSRDGDDEHTHHKEKRAMKKLSKRAASDDKYDDNNQLSPTKSRTEPLSAKKSPKEETPGHSRSMTDIERMNLPYRPPFPQSNGKLEDEKGKSSPTGSLSNLPITQSPVQESSSPKGYFQNDFSFLRRDSSEYSNTKLYHIMEHRPSNVAPNFMYDPQQSDDEGVGYENEDDHIPLNTITEPDCGTIIPMLRRRQSFSKYIGIKHNAAQHEERWPRRMSFSQVEEIFLDWYPIVDEISDPDSKLMRTLIPEAEAAREWTEMGLSQIEGLYENIQDKLETMAAQYRRHIQDQNAAKLKVTDKIERETTALNTALKDVEVLGAKLQYEISSLTVKVADVEDTVASFGNQVLELEDMVQEWEDAQLQRKKGWLNWLISFLLGLHERNSGALLAEVESSQ